MKMIEKIVSYVGYVYSFIKRGKGSWSNGRDYSALFERKSVCEGWRASRIISFSNRKKEQEESERTKQNESTVYPD